MGPPNDERRPRREAALSVNVDDGDIPRVPAAELACRIALLRVYADLHGNNLDPSGWLSAQLRDLADLLECAEREGWFG
jgi:hypothetical protein